MVMFKKAARDRILPSTPVFPICTLFLWEINLEPLSYACQRQLGWAPAQQGRPCYFFAFASIASFVRVSWRLEGTRN